MLMHRVHSLGAYPGCKSAIGTTLGEPAILVAAQEWSRDRERHVQPPIALKAGIGQAVTDASAQGHRPQGMSDDE